MTADTPGGPARHGLGPPKRSPSRVTATTSGDASPMSSAARPALVDEHERREQAREQPVERRVRRAHARRETPRARRHDGKHRRAVGRRRRRASAPTTSAAFSRATAARAAASPSTTIACSASPSAAATATSAPASISMWSASRPIMPSSSGVSRRPATPSSASASVSARARHCDASAVASRHAASACCTASSAARNARDSSVSSGAIAAAASTSARNVGGGPLDLVGLGAARLDRRQLGVDRRQLGADLRRDRGRSPRPRASAWSTVALRVGELGLGARGAARAAGSSPVRERRLVRGAQLGRAHLGRFGVGAAAARAPRRRASTATQLLTRARRFGDERLDDAFVGDGGELALEPAAPLGDEVGEPAAALAQRFGAREQIGDVVATRNRRARARPSITASSRPRSRTRRSCSSRRQLAARCRRGAARGSAAGRSRDRRGAA